MRTDDLPGAAEDAAEAVILRRDDPVAKALLGVVLIGLGRPEEALPCLREAVAAEPGNASFHQGLAAANDALGDGAAAAETLAAGVAACPGSVALRNAAVLHRVRRDDFEGAVALAEQARQDGVADACLYGLKGHALSSLDRHEEATEAYADALKLGPEDPYVRHLVAASGALPGAERAPTDYLRAVFDGYADRFEAHLISLGYRAPGLLRAALIRLLPELRDGETVGPVLDLGCGTGLTAVAVSDLPLRHFIGVDLSSGMLREAAAKQLYAELHEADLMAALAHDERRYPVILAGDVLCYFGSLDEVFAAVRRRLTPRGLFLFSVETLGQQEVSGTGRRDWALGRQGRYAHDAAYVERVASDAGFRIREATIETLRSDIGAPVTGLIVALERTVDDH
jgi:predicted TPR repeat methyltransferase